MKQPRDLYLSEEDDMILIKDSAHDQVVYRINKPELPRTRDGNYSDWIMQLLFKTWIRVDILYQLAKLIQREFPENKISWRETFFVVEKSKYLDVLDDVLTEETGSLVKDTFAQIRLGRKESNDETHGMISKILEVRLKEFGLE